MNHFADRLVEKIRSLNTVLMVGLDPRFKNLPASMREEIDASDPEKVASCFREFCCQIVELAAGRVAVVKPQFAFFEQLGPAGMKALQSVVKFARQKDLLVIGDAKRGDIGSTAEGYANAYLNSQQAGGIPCDALTVNPYMGFDTIRVFHQVAEQNAAGLFVLVKTSNPGSGEFQDPLIDGIPLYQRVAEQVQSLSHASIGDSGYGNVGAVVGATYPDQLNALRKLMPAVPILIPGFGAQGGKANDLAGGFDSRGEGAIVNSSRGIIFAFEKEEFHSRAATWQEAVSLAIDDSIQQLATIQPTST